MHFSVFHISTPDYYRNIGFGTLSVVGKISGVVGPQLVYVVIMPS